MYYVVKITRNNPQSILKQFYLERMLSWGTLCTPSLEEAEQFTTAAGARNARRKYLDRYPRRHEIVQVVRCK